MSKSTEPPAAPEPEGEDRVPELANRALTQWRLDTGVTQLGIAKLLFAQEVKPLGNIDAPKNRKVKARLQRRVGYLEEGKPRLTLAQYQLLKSEGDFVRALRTVQEQAQAQEQAKRQAGALAASRAALPGRGFKDKQQQFHKGSRYGYDMVFFNASRVPGFTDPDLFRTWSENIGHGVTYSFFWNLSSMQHDDESRTHWSLFKGMCNQVMSDVRSHPGWEGKAGRLDVYGHWSAWDITPDEDCSLTKRAIADMSRWAESVPADDQRLLRVNRPFRLDDMPARLRRVILEYTFGAGTTLAYAPRDRSFAKLPPVLLAELTGTEEEFGGPRSERMHCFLGAPFKVNVIEGFWEIEDWYHARERGPFAPI